MRRVLALALVLLVPIPATAAAQRLSGTIVAIDAAAGTLVLETLGASRDERPRPERHTVTLGPDTKVELIQRLGDGPSRARPYQASSLPVTNLKRDDFVTVVGEVHEGRLRARAVTIVHPAQ